MYIGNRAGNFGIKQVKFKDEKFEIKVEQSISEEINDFELVEEERIYCAHENGEVSIKDSTDFSTLTKKQIANSGMLAMKFDINRDQFFLTDDTGLVHILGTDNTKNRQRLKSYKNHWR